MAMSNIGRSFSFVSQDWRASYKSKEIKAEDVALRLIQPGQQIYIDSGVSEPQAIVKAMVENAKAMIDVMIIQFLCLNDKQYFDETVGAQDVFRHNAFFIGAESLRDAVKKGGADYTPVNLSDMPALFRSKRVSIDTAIILVSPPDVHGNCSFGANVDIVKPIAECADNVIAEINPFVPRTHGDSFINMDKIDHFVYNDANDLLEFNYDPPDDVSKSIASNISLLIEDESCLQMGIGAIPNAVFEYLSDKKHLGVHTEVFSDGVVDLVEKGVITCEKKTLHPNKIVCSFTMGSKKLYDFIHDNPFVNFYPVDYVNDTFIISRNRKQVAINAALSVDFTGQVNSDSIGSSIYSGIGGQMDFIRGAAKSEGGKPIIALPSTYTTADGEIKSRIVPFISPFAGVTVTRGDVHYVVTEWGIAYLHGKSIRERVMNMISIAHPDFREMLLDEAKKINYVFKDQEIAVGTDGRVVLYPQKYERYFLCKDGAQLFFRPIKPTDERSMQELYYNLSDQDRFYRFFSPMKTFRRDKVKPLVYIDYKTTFILVAVAEETEEIIGSGGYFLNPNINMAEIAFTVSDAYRNKGVTKLFLDYLIRIAQEQGIDGFFGTILMENKPMLHIIRALKYKLEAKVEEAEFNFKFKFADKLE
jgi:acyl-CoA hydrolase/RimJ/RimL family protein N-acetyltransferase